MNWNDLWRRLTSARLSNHQSPQSNEIRQELMFHFRELIEHQLKNGKSFDAAWDTAEKRFGSLGRYESDCRQLRRQPYSQWRICGLLLLALLLTYRLGFSLPRPIVNEQELLRTQARFTHQN